MKWFRIHSFWAILSWMLLLPAAPLKADDLHYINLHVGDRPAGLAGAYAALSDDTAGCYYNPAGIAMSPSDSISASMNAYVHSVKTYKDPLRGIDGGTLDWEQESSTLLPNFFGMVKKWGAGTLGLSYAVPDSTLCRQKQTFTEIQSVYSDNSIDRFLININDTDQTYLFGPSYALRFSKDFSVGTTFYLYYRDKEIIRNQMLQFQQGEHYWVNYYETQQDWGFRPTLGLMWEPLEKLSIGLTLSKLYLTSSDRESQTLLRDSSSTTPVVIDGNTYDFSDTDTLYLNTADSSDKSEYPFASTLGLAYFVSPKLLFSTDLSYFASEDDKEAVVNVALGAEYYLKESLSLRAGLFTDMANTPALSASEMNQSEHIDIYGATLSLSYFHQHASITLGGSYAMGQGEAQVVADSRVIQDVEMNTYAVFLSSSYSF
jgi:long-chain fatty acid transport protein